MNNFICFFPEWFVVLSLAWTIATLLPLVTHVLVYVFLAITKFFLEEW